MPSPLLSSPLNLAWANRTSSWWNCICGERLSIWAGFDTQNFAIHCQGKKHRTGISIPQEPQRQLAMTQFFSAAPARASEANEPPPHDSEREDDIETSAIESHSSSLPLRLVMKCKGALPLGVPNANALRGKYPIMRRAHEKVHWRYVDAMGVQSVNPPVPERPALVTPVNNCRVFHARQCPITQQCASGCARNKMRILARHISS